VSAYPTRPIFQGFDFYREIDCWRRGDRLW
jgi:hypothetical protein